MFYIIFYVVGLAIILRIKKFNAAVDYCRYILKEYSIKNNHVKREVVLNMVLLTAIINIESIEKIFDTIKHDRAPNIHIFYIAFLIFSGLVYSLLLGENNRNRPRFFYVILFTLMFFSGNNVLSFNSWIIYVVNTSI